jgi:hypothetical protein
MKYIKEEERCIFINPNKVEEFMNRFNLEKLVLSGVEGIPSQSEENVTWASCEHLLYVGKKV